MKQHKNILIVRTDRIGDVVLTLPMAKFIKEKYPNARVTFLVRDYTSVLPRLHRYTDEVITLPIKNGSLNFSELIAMIRAGKFDTAIIVHPKFLISLAVFFARIKQRIGSGYRWYSFLFTDKIYEHRKTGEKHELEYNLNLLKPMGIVKINKESVSFDIQPSGKSEQTVYKLFKSHNINTSKKAVIIHPGSGGSSIDLPISKFISLTEKLARELDCYVLVTGSKEEKETCEKFMVNQNTYNLAGKLDLNELTYVISKADVLIANSTGPIHIAAAFDKDIIGFYPKIKECSVERWGPYTNKRIIFSPTINCSNCTRKQCEQLNCMDSINIDQVFENISQLLS
ncbi:MAG: glycosyltransferase family 9 protein [Melioribacteraceae bacterium]|nr:glycosyltransferase family 9 protein [Melioribacteraceae bacterium]